MKRFVIVILLLFLVVGCDQVNGPTAPTPSPTESKEADTIKPFVRALPAEVTLYYLEPYDLMTGVSALDNIDGDITDNIEIDDDGFDPGVPGVYTIIYQSTDSSGNIGTATRTITVKGLIKYDEGYSDSEVFTGIIDGEVKTYDLRCFPGAWNRRVGSSADFWLGIEGTFVLPSFTGDEARFSEERGQYLDNPSIYFGAIGSRASDNGLTWEIGSTRLPSGAYVRTTERVTFRPFWRYITKDYDNIWNNAPFDEPEYYYFPGDELRMSLFVSRKGFLRLKIEVIKPTDDPYYVSYRESLGIYYPSDFLSPEFESMGIGTIKAYFTRVNAIDQVGNEGKPSLPTNASVSAMVWKEVYLYREIGDTVYKVPFTEDRSINIFCPTEEAFTISYDGVDKTLGGEIISIHPEQAINYGNQD